MKERRNKMKIRELREELERFDEEQEIIIQTQKGHCLYGDIGRIEESDDEDYEGILIMQFCHEGYSPKQALGIE
jgi:hypothetical protein